MLWSYKSILKWSPFWVSASVLGVIGEHLTSGGTWTSSLRRLKRFEIFQLSPMPPRRRAQMLSSLRILGRNDSGSTERWPGKQSFTSQFLYFRASPWPRDTQGLTDWCILNACAPTTMGVSGHLAKVAEVLSFRDHPWSCTSIHQLHSSIPSLFVTLNYSILIHVVFIHIWLRDFDLSPALWLLSMSVHLT